MAIRHGLKPIKPHAQDLSFHKTVKQQFGAVGLPTDMPSEFDFDAGLTMPDQELPDAYFNIPALPFGCTGETQSDCCVDGDLVRYNPKFVYDNTRVMEGTQGEDVGCDIRDSLKSLSIYGLQALGDTSDISFGRRRGPYMDILSNRNGLDYFDAIRVALWRNYTLTGVKRSASVGTPWFAEWGKFNLDSFGRMTAQFIYNGNPQEYAWHNWKISGVRRVNGELCLIAKSWQGKEYGNGGFSYLTREAVNKAFAIQYTGAYLPGTKFDPTDAAQRGNVIQVINEQILNFLKRQLALLLAKLP